MKNKEKDMTPVCEKCGRVAPINMEKSNQNWIVYEVKEPCKCGGRFRPKCLLEEVSNEDQTG